MIITQSLGGTYTLRLQAGLRASSSGWGCARLRSAGACEAPKKYEGSAEEAVWTQLKTVFDPEIPVNVVDLGLIYDCRVNTSEAGGTSVLVRMTLTAPGCGMGPAIAADARQKILEIEELTMPRWSWSGILLGTSQ